MLKESNDAPGFLLVGNQVTLRPFVGSNITPVYLGCLRNEDKMKYSNQIKFEVNDVQR